MAIPKVPNMPLFEPSHDPAAAAIFSRAEAMSSIGAGQKQFSFPADEAFWDNFVAQVRLNAGAAQEPLFSVSASHDPSNPRSVNQLWMRHFVGAWEQQNPHTVTVVGDGGTKRFYASEEFWETVVEELAKQRQGPGDVVTITSSQLPGTTPIVASREAWTAAVDKWEADKECDAGTRQERLQLRSREADEIEAERSAADPLPMPCMWLSERQVEQQGSVGSTLEPDVTEFDFSADDNFWQCLKALAATVPGALDPPAFDVDTDHGQRTQVGRSFLRKFLAAWHKEFPLVITVALRNGGQVRSTVFNACPDVWRDLIASSQGRATDEQQHRIPEGICLASSSSESAAMPPVVLTVPAYYDVCARWPSPSPMGSQRSFGSSFSSRSERLRRPHAPCVRLPKPGGGSTREHRRRAPLPPGAVPRKEVSNSAPTIALHLHQGILDGIAGTRRRQGYSRSRGNRADAGVATGGSLLGDP